MDADPQVMEWVRDLVPIDSFRSVITAMSRDVETTTDRHEPHHLEDIAAVMSTVVHETVARIVTMVDGAVQDLHLAERLDIVVQALDHERSMKRPLSRYQGEKRMTFLMYS